MSRIAKILAALLMSLFALSSGADAVWAQPGGWERSFNPATLRTYLLGQVDGIVLVNAGTPSKALTEAAEVLKEALGKTGLTTLVMDSQALGEVGDLGDAEIVKKAQHLPISHVVILRVYSPNALVGVFDRYGAAQSSFVLREGDVLPPNPKNAAPPPPPAMNVVSAQPKQEDPRALEARDAYLAEYVWFEPSQVRKGKLTDWDQDSTVYMGAGKKKLGGNKFYVTTGRKDLAAKYSSRNTVRYSLILGGIAVTAGGAAIAFGFREDCSMFGDGTMERVDCDDGNSTKLTAGAITAGVGFLSWLVGMYLINPHPISPAEAQAIADKYNDDLARDLGLPAGYAPPPEPAPADAAPAPAPLPAPALAPQSRWRIEPVVGPGAGGLVLSGRF